jgi:hypothetical protein
VKLTLRTLLAYLDDTLESGRIKEIGAKVAESDAAQELIARIKQVTRRRRLLTPPAGKETFDANAIAEYLDNELDSDQVSELEKLCLESDVHLAEIAACHQILTLVLGEPALVPPKAKERMYGLVKGREAIPYRRAPASPRAAAESTDSDDLPPLLGASWMRWLLPIAGLLLIGALGLAVWQILPDKERRGDRRGTDVTDGSANKDKDRTGAEADKRTRRTDKGATDKGTRKTDNGDKDKRADEQDDKDKTGPSDAKDPTVVAAPAPPSKERVAVAGFEGPATAKLPALLVRRPGGKAWQRLARGAIVSTTEPLVALPGSVGVLSTRTGVELTLRGHVPEFSLHSLQDFILESAVVLHKNADFDLDVTLLRGRAYLANRKEKGPAKVRLRFEGQVWDLTLAEPGAEAGVELFKHYPRDVNYRAGEEPRAWLYFCLLRGEGDIRIGAFQSTYRLEAPQAKEPGAAVFEWDSFTRATGPHRLKEVPPIWSKDPPDNEPSRSMQGALKNLNELLGAKDKSVEVGLKECLDRKEPESRALAIYCLEAIDEVEKLVEILEDGDLAHYGDRAGAIYALRRWISRNANQGKLLYDAKTKTGVLLDKGFKSREAETVFDLLHDFREEDRRNPDTFEALAACLQHRRVSIAELGFWHLQRESVGVKLPQGFNAALPQEDREKYADQIKDMIAKKQLPPPRKEKPRGKDNGGGR